METSVKNDLEMGETLTKEACLFVLTIIATKISTEIAMDFVWAICTYTVARLFYWAFEKKIKAFLLKLSSWFKRLKRSK